ncbi:MAG: spore germination protein GerW family protein [Methanothrix sp.]|nr:spore germination protein GerW family protein [Methanothrix sp.]
MVVMEMDNLSEILRTITEEMHKSLSARTVICDPITVEGKTIVPLVSVGMGFGAGAGMGEEKGSPGEGARGGAGGGLGIKPVAVIVIDQHGVRVERLADRRHSLVEHLAEALPAISESLQKRKETHVAIKEP